MHLDGKHYLHQIVNTYICRHKNWLCSTWEFKVLKHGTTIHSSKLYDLAPQSVEFLNIITWTHGPLLN